MRIKMNIKIHPTLNILVSHANFVSLFNTMSNQNKQ